MLLKKILAERIEAIMSRSNLDGMPALIQNASREEFGDYQINGMMAAAKILKENPRKLKIIMVFFIFLLFHFFLFFPLPIL